MKRALILAAGKGKRLGELTQDIPKCLLNVSSDKTILDYSLEAIDSIGIKEIVIVSGFAHDALKDYLIKKWLPKFAFKIIYNPRFYEYNNIYSAYLAKDLWNDDTVLFNSDIVFDPQILKNTQCSILSTQYSFLVVDNKKELIEEDMKVVVDKKGTVKRIHKSLDPKKSFGEYIGILYLRGNERLKFLKSIEKNIQDKNFDLYYEDALDQITENISVYPCSTEGKQWTEVDTKEDLEKAKTIANELIALAL